LVKNDRTVDTVLKALEPYAVKVASTVLRRERRGNLPDLSDQVLPYINGMSFTEMIHQNPA
ncbi:MAG: hypothetical protein ABSF81_18440, partial [Bacteroidales bacterium]